MHVWPLVLLVFALWLFWKLVLEPRVSRRAGPSAAGGEASRGGAPAASGDEDCGEGAPPAPLPRLFEGPNVRIVDLSPLPEADVRIGRFGVTRGVLETRRPVACQVFAISPATADAWLSMGDLALSLVLRRLREMRTATGGKALLHVAGQAPGPAEEQRFADGGMEIARHLVVVGSEGSVTLAEALALPQPAPPAAPQRPVLPYTVHNGGLVGHAVAFEIDRAVFLDLRRQSLDALTSLAAFDRVDEVLGNLRRGDDPERLIIWCVAPWVFDCWRGREDEVTRRFEVWTKRLPGPRHRLAVFESAGNPALVVRLAALGLRPLTEACGMKVNGRSFRVPFAIVLDDITGYEAAAVYGGSA